MPSVGLDEKLFIASFDIQFKSVSCLECSFVGIGLRKVMQFNPCARAHSSAKLSPRQTVQIEICSYSGLNPPGQSSVSLVQRLHWGAHLSEAWPSPPNSH